jgi:DNA-binding transcriptional LysR family regulator
MFVDWLHLDRIMNTRDIEAFVAVVETGSIVGASARLHLTQPGISRRLQSLEEALGTPLLDRLSKPLKPSAAGRKVYELGRKVLHAVQDLREGAAPDAEPAGELRLGVPPFLAELTLADPLDALRSRFPRLSIRIIAAWSPLLVSQIDDGSLDLAAIVMPDYYEAPAHLAVAPLAQSPALIVASHALPVARDAAGNVSLQSLAEHVWVLNQDGCGLRTAVRRVFDTLGLPFDIAVEAYGAELQLSLIARGMGIGVVTPGALARSRFKEAVSILPVPAFTVGMRASLVHVPRSSQFSAPIALLRDELVKSLEGTVGMM